MARRKIFGIPLHRVVGGLIMFINGLIFLKEVTDLPRTPEHTTETNESASLSSRMHLAISLLGQGLGYTLQAHNPQADYVFNRVYNSTVNGVLYLFSAANNVQLEEVDEINLIRDDIDGVRRRPNHYRLRQ